MSSAEAATVPSADGKLVDGRVMGVEVVEYSGEWEDGDDASGDEDGTRCVRVASERFTLRESRILAACEKRQKDSVLGDKDVEVVTQCTEWSGGVADSDDDGTDAGEDVAAQSYAAREKRLSLVPSDLKDRPLGDADVEIHTQDVDWGHAEELDADTHEDDHEKRMTRQATIAHEAREKRLRTASEALGHSKTMGDADVEVVVQSRDWAGLGDVDAMDSDGVSSDDEDPEPKFQEKMTAQATKSHTFREERLEMAQKTLREEAVRGDAEVELVHSKTEWAGAASDGEERAEDTFRRVATSQGDAREQRLSRAAARLESGDSIGDVEVEVVQQHKEWAGVDGAASGDEDATVHATASFASRERRLAATMAAGERAMPLGDADVHVVTQAREWQGAPHGDSGDEGAEAVFAKQATIRERRISIAAENKPAQLGDAEVEIVGQRREWSACVPDSDSEADDDRGREMRAQKSEARLVDKREERLEHGNVFLKLGRQMGDHDVEIHEQEKEWAADNGAQSEDEGQQIVRVATISSKKREARMSQAPSGCETADGVEVAFRTQSQDVSTREVNIQAEQRVARRGFNISAIDAYRLGSERCADRCAECTVS